jgi:hypothetical protein
VLRLLVTSRMHLEFGKDSGSIPLHIGTLNLPDAPVKLKSSSADAQGPLDTGHVESGLYCSATRLAACSLGITKPISLAAHVGGLLTLASSVTYKVIVPSDSG